MKTEFSKYKNLLFATAPGSAVDIFLEDRESDMSDKVSQGNQGGPHYQVQ